MLIMCQLEPIMCSELTGFSFLSQETLKRYAANARDIFDNHFSEEVISSV